FLSVFDVHVQRVPATGVIERIAYRAGKFLSADLDKASEDNERNSVLLRTEDGHELVVVQIAGLVARRIVCQITEGDKVAAGATCGAAVRMGVVGRSARLLEGTSNMGADRRSLSDAVSFGVAPALVLDMWHADGERIGWVAALIFAVCIVLRLALFNNVIDDT